MEEPRNRKLNLDRWDIDRVRYQMTDRPVNEPPSPKREVRSLADLLPDVMAGLEQPQSEDILMLKKTWPELCGAQIAQHSEPGFIKEFILYVHVDHPGWIPELERIKRLILGKLQSRYVTLCIRQLHFILEHK